MRVKNFLISPTMRCNLNCPHCMNEGSQNIDITREIVRAALADLEEVERFYIGGSGETTENLDGMEIILDELRRSGLHVTRFRFLSNLTRKSQRFVELMKEFQAYGRAKKAGKILTSKDVFHFGHFVKAKDYYYSSAIKRLAEGQSLDPEVSERVKAWIENSFGDKVLFIQDPEMRAKHEENIEWYKEKTGMIIHDRPFSDSEILFRGNAAKYEKEIRSLFPHMVEENNLPYCYFFPDPEGMITTVVVYPTGEISGCDAGYQYQRDNMGIVGNVLDGMQACMDRYNQIDKVKTIGKIDAYAMQMEERLKRTESQDLKARYIGYFMNQIRPLIPDAEKQIETEGERIFMDVIKAAIEKEDSLFKRLPPVYREYPGPVPETFSGCGYLEDLT